MTKKESFLFLALGAMLFVSCLTLVFNAVDVATMQSATKVEYAEKTYYALCESTEKETCENATMACMEKGYAGCVFESGENLYVVYNAYQNINDATLVKNTLGENFEIVPVTRSGICIEGVFSQTESGVLYDALNLFDSIFCNLCDIAISLDTNIYDTIQAKLNVNKAYSSFVQTKSNFLSLFNVEEANFKSLEEDMQKMEEKLLDLSMENYSSMSQNYSSLIKQKYCELLLDL